jgi:hypothetical protein
MLESKAHSAPSIATISAAGMPRWATWLMTSVRMTTLSDASPSTRDLGASCFTVEHREDGRLIDNDG